MADVSPPAGYLHLHSLPGPPDGADPARAYREAFACCGPAAPIQVAGVPGWLLDPRAAEAGALRSDAAWRWVPLRDPSRAGHLYWHGLQSGLALADARRALLTALEGSGPRIARIGARAADDLIASFAPDGRTEMVRRYAQPLTLDALYDLFGIGEQHLARVGQAALCLIERTADPALCRRRLRETLAAEIPSGRGALARAVATHPGVPHELAAQCAATWLVEYVRACVSVLAQALLRPPGGARTLPAQQTAERRVLASAAARAGYWAGVAATDQQVAAAHISTGDLVITPLTSTTDDGTSPTGSTVAGDPVSALCAAAVRSLLLRLPDVQAVPDDTRWSERDQMPLRVALRFHPVRDPLGGAGEAEAAWMRKNPLT